MTPPSHTPFNKTIGSTADASCQSPEDFFSIFFTDVVWQYLVDKTNKYAADKISAMEVKIMKTKIIIILACRPIQLQDLSIATGILLPSRK